ncbi:MAG: hypothetical protein HBSAPP04_13950 [Ignavibacteriaceae bacterium]|nr:MAG: hypothetical protein HBSAPP04_13950 [Ignavibacteriaceae bacterium]
MAEEKDSEGLIEFISDNMHFQSQEKKNLVEFAIDEIVSKDLKPGKKYIESIIRNGVPSEFVEKALNSYKNNQKPFLMVDEMLSNYFTIANGTTVPSYLDLYKSVIAIGDRNTIIEKIRKHFVSAVESND